MYKRTVSEPNGEFFTNFDIYSCDICGAELSECGGSWVTYKGKDICVECGEHIFSKTVSATHWLPSLFYLKGLEYEYFHRYKKTRKSLAKYLRETILHKYKFTCQQCGLKENLSIDHIKPVKHGGTNSPDNLTVLCKSCNSKKGAKYENKNNTN